MSVSSRPRTQNLMEATNKAEMCLPKKVERAGVSTGQDRILHFNLKSSSIGPDWPFFFLKKLILALHEDDLSCASSPRF